ncbi:hypothetical protein PQB85_gp86 [Erwinia phage Midgardsormr38]|uniref:Uncharacterized protein n=1 Tax=Erwinia phage Midgardsormr38 TaxID=2663326 RepID=A0A5Q2FA27_9CAUD|nr:hypothetical protein PQB85_gp86 [Erwinia phage Midgardsormr38]QGF22043.1 hypothetical protein [Erwinia phage Midgardsormr38]
MRPSKQPSDIHDSSLRRTLNKKIRTLADSSVTHSARRNFFYRQDEVYPDLFSSTFRQL